MANPDRKDATRSKWLATLEKYRRDFERPGSAEYWSPSLDFKILLKTIPVVLLGRGAS